MGGQAKQDICQHSEQKWTCDRTQNCTVFVGVACPHYLAYYAEFAVPTGTAIVIGTGWTSFEYFMQCDCSASLY